jgi:DNA-binding GntR family transcriptional regulator
VAVVRRGRRTFGVVLLHSPNPAKQAMKLIAAAVRAGDPEWARAVMTAHIRNARAVMVRAAAQPGGHQPGRQQTQDQQSGDITRGESS